MTDRSMVEVLLTVGSRGAKSAERLGIRCAFDDANARTRTMRIFMLKVGAG